MNFGKFAIWFFENDGGGGQRPFGTFLKIHPFWRCRASLSFTNASHLRRYLKCTVESHKCNQCDFASSRADGLRMHLKRHCGEKSNNCNQCYFASSQVSNLMIRLKTQRGGTHCGDNPFQHILIVIGVVITWFLTAFWESIWNCTSTHCRETVSTYFNWDCMVWRYKVLRKY